LFGYTKIQNALELRQTGKSELPEGEAMNRESWFLATLTLGFNYWVCLWCIGRNVK
jgi:hypothetical protein